MRRCGADSSGRVPGLVEPRMVTDRQVRLLRKKRMEKKTLEAADVGLGTQIREPDHGR